MPNSRSGGNAPLQACPTVDQEGNAPLQACPTVDQEEMHHYKHAQQ